MANLMSSHGCASIQSRPCTLYMRTCNYLKDRPPEDDAEREGRRGACSILVDDKSRTSSPRGIRHPFPRPRRNDALATHQGGKKLFRYAKINCQKHPSKSLSQLWDYSCPLVYQSCIEQDINPDLAICALAIRYEWFPGGPARK